MALRLLDRIHRLVAADAHGIVESLEDRALLLKQHLREAELELGRKRVRLEALAEEERRLGDDATRLEEALRSLDEDAEMALAAGEQELARFALRKLIPTRGEVEALRRRRGEIGEERERLTPRLARQEAELEQLRARVRAQHVERERAERWGPGADAASVSDEEVELELLRRQRAAEART